MSPAFQALIAFAVISLTFCAFYGAARRMNNYGIVDIVWSYAFGLVAVLYAFTGQGWIGRRWVMAGIVAVWSARLGSHLYHRVMGHHPVEDGRYQQLRRDWAGHFAPKMFGFFQMQAASVVLLSAPFLLMAANVRMHFSAIEIIGAILWLVAIAGESVADAQLGAFKKNPANKGKVCDVGLWHYSRHPNYFFEWLIWVSYFVMACGSHWGWVSFICPACILYLLLRVTGIPLTEEHSLRSRGDAYKKYQSTTSAFIPWFPKSI